MDNSNLLNVLKSDSMTFTVAEVRRIMDEELGKSPEEMDTELIDICAQILDKEYSKHNAYAAGDSAPKKKTSKVIKLKKVLIAAAVVAAVCAIAIPVGAKYVSNDASDKIVQFFGDHFKVDLRGEKDDSQYKSLEGVDIEKELTNAGFFDVKLPEKLLNGQIQKDDIEISEDEYYLSTSINFLTPENIDANIIICRHKTELTTDLLYEFQVGPQFDSAKQIDIGNMTVLVFSGKDQVLVNYTDFENNTEYIISMLDCGDMDYAMEVAETVKE